MSQRFTEEIDAWVGQLRGRFSGEKIAVCLEQTKGALIYALMKYDFLVLYPINPKQLSSFRDALGPSGAKDDPTDPEEIRRFYYGHNCRRPDVVARRLAIIRDAKPLTTDEAIVRSSAMQVRALAFKWIRIIYRCWKNRTHYDETTYLASLKKRNSPTLDHLPSSVD